MIRFPVWLNCVYDEERTREATFNQLGTDADGLCNGGDAPGRVLLAMGDEDPFTIAKVLCERGYEVSVAESADNLHILHAASLFDLLLLNDEIGIQDGLRLCSNIRSQETTRNVPVALLVSEGEEAWLAKGLEIRVRDCLVKPVNSNEMYVRAPSQIRRKRYEFGLVRSSPQLDRSGSRQPHPAPQSTLP